MKGKLAKISAVVITIALVAILLSQIEVSDVITTLAGIDPLYLIAGFVLYVCSYFFRASRFKMLIHSKKVKLSDLFAIVSVHNMVNSILPARTGELSYIYLAKKTQGIHSSEGITTLITARMFDALAISIIFLFSASVLGSEMHMSKINIWLSGIFILALVVLSFAIILYHGKKAMVLFENLMNRAKIKRFRVITFIVNKGYEVTDSFELIRAKNVFPFVFIVSIAIWCSMYAMIFSLLVGMGIDIDIWMTILGSTLTFVISILPIQGVGEFGTLEGAWTVAFIGLGFTKDVAIVSGFSYHIIRFIYFLILGGYGMYAIRYRKNTSEYI